MCFTAKGIFSNYNPLGRKNVSNFEMLLEELSRSAKVRHHLMGRAAHPTIPTIPI
jgi:hypothetical protein